MTTVYICKCCGNSVTPYVQPALMPGRAGTRLIECHNPACENYMLTLDLRDDVSQRYVKVNVSELASSGMIEVK